MSRQETRSEIPVGDIPVDDLRRSAIALRPIGTPLPLGFVGLAISAAVLSCLQLGWIPLTEQHQASLALIAFACPLEAVAMVLLFLARDAPTGAGMGVLSFSWVTLGLLLLTSRPGSTSAAVAVFLFAAGAAMLPAVISASISKLVPALILLMAAAKFVLTGVYEYTAWVSWERVAGWEGIVLGAVAIYGALAADLEGEMHRTILPMGRWGLGRRAIREGLAGQAGKLEREPGVRPQA
ncbi:MAG TPA: hypothetical protein VFH58_03060 [Acidimicrobiales bacterium]|nr:hypothetical protein [Acidimicrobiales bacterium]